MFGSTRACGPFVFEITMIGVVAAVVVAALAIISMCPWKECVRVGHEKVGVAIITLGLRRNREKVLLLRQQWLACPKPRVAECPFPNRCQWSHTEIKS